MDRPTLLNFSSTNKKEEEKPSEIDLLFQKLRPHSGILEINDQRHYFIKGEDIYKQCSGKEKETLEINGVSHQLIGQIKYGDSVGVGTAGAVIHAEINGNKMAEKEIRLHRNNLNHIRELEVIKKCRECPQIVDYYGYTITGERLSIYMEIMDTCAKEILQLQDKASNLNTNLNENTNKNENTTDTNTNASTSISCTVGFPEKILSKLTLEIVKGLKYLKEKHRTIHRDLHPGNILLDRKGNIKLCDFGVSGRLNDNSLMDTYTQGCLEYMAPERFREGAEEWKDYGSPADVWSLGILMIHLAKGKNPYMTNTAPNSLNRENQGSNSHRVDTNPNSLKREIKVLERDPPRLQQSEGFSLELCNFVEKCVQKEADKRPSFDEILEDPFVLKGAEISKEFVAEWVKEQLNLGKQK